MVTTIKTKVGNIKRDWGQYMVKFLLSFFILIQKVKVKVAQRCPWNSPGQNTGVSSLSLLHGVFPTQGSNISLPYWRQILYQQSQQGSPRILEWIAYPFSRGFSWPRNWTRVSCTAVRFFPNWATRDACMSCDYFETLFFLYHLLLH